MVNFDFLKNLRLQNIFNPQHEPVQGNSTFEGPFNPVMSGDQPTPMGQQQGGGLRTIAQRMAELYQPQTESIDRYNTMIDQHPERPQPGALRKIGAVALGTLGDLFGPQGSGKVAYNETTGNAGYDRKVADWKNQIEPLERSANIERQSNSNQRILAGQTVTAEMRQEAQDAKIENDRRRTAISESRARVYDFKARNPNAKFLVTPSGIRAVHPQTGAVIADLGPSGVMDEQERREMEQEFNLARIEAQANNAQELEGTRQTNRLDLQAEGSEDAQILAAIRAALGGNGSGGGTTPSSSQERIRQYITARELYNTDPDLADFIEFGPGANDFSIVGNPSPAQRARIQQRIYSGGGNRTAPTGGNRAPSLPTGNTGGGGANNSSVLPGNFGGRVPITGGNSGNMSTIPRTNVPPPQSSGRGNISATPTTAPTGRPMISNARNKRTGEVRPMVSYDGGKTWSPYDASAVQP